MNEAVVMRLLGTALLAIIGYLWVTLDGRLSALESFASRGDRCIAERCSVIETELGVVKRSVDQLPPRWLIDDVLDLETRMRVLEKEHSDFRQ